MLNAIRLMTWFDRDRARDYARCIFLISMPGLLLYYLVGIGAIAWPGRDPGLDFLSFWSAARLTLTHGPGLAYDGHAMMKAQNLGAHFFVFLYPPPYLAAVLPFGLLPFRWALILWMVINLAVFFLTARRLLPSSPWVVAAFPPAFISAGFGQNGGLSGALYAGVALLLEQRPFVAGLLVGGLICKPQLAVLIPVGFLAARQWRAIAGAAISSAALLLLALVAFGPETYRAFLADAGLSWRTLNFAPLWPKMVGLYPFLRMLGATGRAATAAQLFLFAGCAATVWVVWSKPIDMMAKMSVLVVCSLLATPYAFLYDLVMLIVPLCWLIQQGMREGVLPWEKAGLAVVYIFPFAAPFAELSGFNGSWLVLVCFLFLLLRRQSACPPVSSPAAVASAAP